MINQGDYLNQLSDPNLVELRKQKSNPKNSNSNTYRHKFINQTTAGTLSDNSTTLNACSVNPVAKNGMSNFIEIGKGLMS